MKKINIFWNINSILEANKKQQKEKKAKTKLCFSALVFHISKTIRHLQSIFVLHKAHI